MNPDSHDLIQRHMAGLLTEDEAATLQTRLKADTDLRRLYLHYMNLDVALEAQAGSRDRVIDLLRAAPLTEHKPAGRWFSWRPLTAAAAGIVFGMFCTSMVWALAGPGKVRRVPLSVADGSFENRDFRPKPGFPDRAGVWAGDAAQSVSAADGTRMARLEPVAEGGRQFSYLHQIVPLPADAPQVEVSVSFQAADMKQAHRYALRLAGFAESPPEVRPLWREFTESAVSSVFRGTTVKADEQGWKTLTARLDLPPGTRSLVIAVGARSLDAAAPLQAHFIDEVKATLIIPETPLP
jgi:hypothetical protein